MNSGITVIADQHEFEELSQFVNSILKTESLIPEQVFKPIFGEYLFEEFDRTMSDEFWDTLQKLALLSGDSHIVVAVLQPSPTDYFYREFGYYNWFKIPSDLTRDDYWSVLELEPEGSPADALISNSEVVVWVSPSKKWAIWGERSAEICIMASNLNVNLGTEPTFLRWRSVDGAITKLRPSNFVNKSIPIEFIGSLKINFSPRSAGMK